jgi:poly-gamma-glutamate synthesis protein (capsule biosynthesis protein)
MKKNFLFLVLIFFLLFWGLILLIKNKTLSIETINNNPINISTPTQENKKIKLLFAGDIMLDRSVKIKVEKKFNGDYSSLFNNIKDYLNSFNYVVVNLEGPVSNRGVKVGSIYSFRMSPKILSALNDTNIKILNLANNHIWDYGQEAFLDTLFNLEKNNLYYFGAGKNKNQAYGGLILEKYDNKIGIIGFSEFLKNIQANDNKAGIAYLDEEIFKKSIKELRKKVDILIITFHWGNEYQYEPNKKQKYFARLAIDLGADLIIGHHPHIVQKIERYKNKFIFYSLGNFIFDQNFSKETMRGGLVELEIENRNIKNIYFRWSYLNNNFQIEKISEPLLVYDLNGRSLLLKIADEPKEWEQGLMFVKLCSSPRIVCDSQRSLDFDGMIFIFPDKQIRYFWNKNTFVDLDVYWLDDDKIIGRDFLPSIEKTKEIKTISSNKPVNKVIEVIK